MTGGIAGFPVFVEQVIVQCLHGLQFVGLEEGRRLVQVGVGDGVGSGNGIVEPAVVVGAQHLRARHLVGKTDRAAVADAGGTHLTFLRRHEDHTVSGTGTVDGCRSILQHRDALYFRGVEVVEGLGT